MLHSPIINKPFDYALMTINNLMLRKEIDLSNGLGEMGGIKISSMINCLPQQMKTDVTLDIRAPVMK